MTSPLGPISLAQGHLHTMLADSATFRTWVGAANQAEALDDIYRVSLPPPDAGGVYTVEELQGYRPFALVWTAPAQGYALTADAMSPGIELRESGSLIIRFEQDVPAELSGENDDPAEIDLRFMNTIGQIFADLNALSRSATAGYLTITDLDLVISCERTHEDHVEAEGDAILSVVEARWRGGVV